MRWILLFFPFWMSAQNGTVLNADFRFADGVYLSARSLLANQPDIAWANIRGEMVQLPEDHRVQIDGYGYKDGDYGRPYAIGLDGVAYLFVRQDPKLKFYEFAGLRGAGRYPTVRYDTIEHRRQLMRAYNPATGMAFREGYVERDRRRTVHRVVDMTTGERYALSPAVVAELVAAEPDILDAVRGLTDEDEQKLTRALVLYNQRRPLVLPSSQAQD